MANNPFMITSNQDYGIHMDDLKNSELVKYLEHAGKDNNFKDDEKKPNLSFLYTRESDQIGAEVEIKTSSLAKAFDKGKRREKSRFEGPMGQSQGEINSTYVAEALYNYKHEPKSENPLYRTTSNDIGTKKPSIETFTDTKYSRSQNFSKSFNRIIFQDQGLNTSLTRSNVHERLDSHFV